VIVSGEVEYDAWVERSHCFQRAAVAKIGFDHADAIPAPLQALVLYDVSITDSDRHLGIFGEQPLDKVRPNEARASGDDYFTAL
jgi:hypothetical protein